MNISVEVYRGSMLSLLLFIIVVEDLSCEFRNGCTSKLLYTDDLVIVDESLGELKVRLKVWKDRLEEKRLKLMFGRPRSCALDTMSRNQDCICQIPMWCMYERHWCEFNSI